MPFDLENQNPNRKSDSKHQLYNQVGDQQAIQLATL
jgi:hypothetical protein